MLYLTVGQGDKLFIGEGDDTIVIEVTRYSAGQQQLQLGVNAPRNIKVNTVFADASKQFKRRQQKDKVDAVIIADDIGNRKGSNVNTGNRAPVLPKRNKRHAKHRK